MKGKVSPDIMNLIFLQILHSFSLLNFLLKFMLSERGNRIYSLHSPIGVFPKTCYINRKPVCEFLFKYLRGYLKKSQDKTFTKLKKKRKVLLLCISQDRLGYATVTNSCLVITNIFVPYTICPKWVDQETLEGCWNPSSRMLLGSLQIGERTQEHLTPEINCSDLEMVVQCPEQLPLSYHPKRARKIDLMYG